MVVIISDKHCTENQFSGKTYFYTTASRSKERKTKLRRQKVHIDYESNAVDADFEREMRSEGLGDGEMMARRIVRAHVEEGGEDAGSSQGPDISVRIYLPK